MLIGVTINDCSLIGAGYVFLLVKKGQFFVQIFKKCGFWVFR